MIIGNLIKHNGAWFTILCAADTDEQANAYMHTHDNAGLLCITDDGKRIIAAMDDKGAELMTRAAMMSAHTAIFAQHPGSGLPQACRAATQELHNIYYAQFVTPVTLRLVATYIGMEKIKASTDPHFNDIPLHLWDRIAPNCSNHALSKANGTGGTSLSDGLCIAKQAARILKASKE